MLDARGATSSMSPRDGAGDEVPEYLDRAASQEKPRRIDAGFTRFRASKSAPSLQPVSCAPAADYRERDERLICRGAAGAIGGKAMISASNGAVSSTAIVGRR